MPGPRRSPWAYAIAFDAKTGKRKEEGHKETDMTKRGKIRPEIESSRRSDTGYTEL